MPAESRLVKLPEPAELRLRVYPDPILKKVSRPFSTPLPAGLKEISARMLEIMREHRGIGLAGPQAGLSWRIIVYDLGEDGGGEDCLLNPSIISSSGSAADEEGCLSFPELRAEVSRAEEVTVTGLDLDGNEVEIEAGGLAAVMFQHEIDHLDGISFVDRLGFTEKLSVKARLRELEEEAEAAG